MTKKTILLITLTLSYINIFAQESKPCLFIGRYDKDKTYCSDKGWVHEEVKDKQEYELKRTEFREKHKADVGMTYPTDFFSEKECVIVYEYQRRNGSFNCDQTFVNLIRGNSVESCKDQLAKQIIKNGKDYYLSQPNIIYTWQGKGETQKQSIIEDFDGVTGKFSLLTNQKGDKKVLAQFSNTTSDKRAILYIKTAEGKILDNEYILPGGTLTKTYDSKSLEINLIYDGSIESKKPSLVDDVKEIIRKTIIIENGNLKVGTRDKKFMKISTSAGPRG